jgi:hypothetical protein
VRYRLASGRDQTISVTGPPVRVGFDPDAADVLQQFAARGLRALLGGGDHLLFLVCVLLPLRRAGSAAALFAAAAAGQALTMAIGAGAAPPAAAWLAWAAMIAASAVVIAALQTVVSSRLRWVTALAFAFGVMNGAAFADVLAQAGQFAGSHRVMAAAAFGAVALLGELWLGALAWATRIWLDRRGVSDRAFATIAAVVIAHSAIHRVVERGSGLATLGSITAERALVWLTVGWAGIMLLVAATEMWSAARSDPRARGGRADAVTP